MEFAVEAGKLLEVSLEVLLDEPTQCIRPARKRWMTTVLSRF